MTTETPETPPPSPSLKDELKELIDYLAPLGAHPAATRGVDHDHWLEVRGDLKRAADALAEAEDGTRNAAYSSAGSQARRLRVCAESVRDIKREVEDLRRRAGVLADRAKPDKKADPDAEAKARAAILESEKTEAAEYQKIAHEQRLQETLKTLKDLEETAKQQFGEDSPAHQAARDSLQAELTKRLGLKPTAKVETEPGVTWPQAVAKGTEAAKRLESAQGTLETARGRLGDLGAADEPTKAFAGQLDTVAEMTLVLRRRLEDVLSD